jgi:SNF2 family DNA or RNA helicase
MFFTLYIFIHFRYGLKKNGNLLIADEMGLGKSLQALAIARNYLDDWPLYIFCPSSVKYSWKKVCVIFLSLLIF